MATFKSFDEIEAWQQARELTRFVYAASGRGAFGRDFGLRDQIRRAAVSALSNIAEGFGRGGVREFIQFLRVARGSTSEVGAQLYVAFDQGYLTDEEFRQLQGQATRAGSVISGFIRYLQSASLRANPSNQRNPMNEERIRRTNEAEKVCGK
jgi:four helix bundle protein